MPRRFWRRLTGDLIELGVDGREQRWIEVFQEPGDILFSAESQFG